MKCYDFELNISAYIDGELKQAVRSDFLNHEEICSICSEKLQDIEKLLQNLPELNKLSLSGKFSQKLQEKIRDIDNRGPAFWNRLANLTIFGFEPLPAMGMAAAMMMIIGSAYFMLDQDQLPNVDLQKLSTRTEQDNTNFKSPSVVNPVHGLPVMADSDTAAQLEKKKVPDTPIHLVGRGK